MATTVVVEPRDVVMRRTLEVVGWFPLEWSAGPELRDRALTALFVVHLVARDGEEAFAHGVFLVLFERVNGRPRENGWAGGIKVGEQREPVHDPEPLLARVGLGMQVVPRQVSRGPQRPLRLLVNLGELLGLDP